MLKNMCESNVYVRINGKEELLIKDVISLVPKEDTYIFIDITGRKYEIENVIIEFIDFISHKIVLKRKVL
ncbi:MAG: CooT family nickel-binding protein [Candidatus Methanomethylicia archaeon]|nr:CooT family nickel-binding protein [Candidatus Methanomethylicia archaeon]MCX8168912.1 CooT family nickel-binding protein [Candidatus Methanomethylicia archaeon]MDW7988644.1 CooT family nickel-binding protein [Nitrososphaerota archaeon]